MGIFKNMQNSFKIKISQNLNNKNKKYFLLKMELIVPKTLAKFFYVNKN